MSEHVPQFLLNGFTIFYEDKEILRFTQNDR